jgi:hypothetical protein
MESDLVRSAVRNAAISKAAKARLANNPHPRGFLGKKHTAQSKAIISRKASAYQQSFTKQERHKLALERISKAGIRKAIRGSWMAGWRVIGGKRIYARSRWEANYARFLEWQKQQKLLTDWEHEPTTFWFKGIKRGVTNYTPDFRITTISGGFEYHEVKGWMDSKSATKIKRMAKYFPLVVLRVIKGDWFKANRNLIGLVPEWEVDPPRVRHLARTCHFGQGAKQRG